MLVVSWLSGGAGKVMWYKQANRSWWSTLTSCIRQHYAIDVFRHKPCAIGTVPI